MDFHMEIEKSDVSLWWPNGWGEQALYDLEAQLHVDGGKEGLQLVDKITKKVAFRTVELVQEELSLGLSFFFKVRKTMVFA